MPDRSHNHSDVFKKATESTLKAIAKTQDAEVLFENAKRPESNVSMLSETLCRLPAPENKINYRLKSFIRGLSDTYGMILRHHDKKIHAKYSPQEKQAAALFNSLEKARVEGCGSRHMKGAQANILSLINEKCRRYNLENVRYRSEDSLQDMLYLLAFHEFSGCRLPRSADAFFQEWQTWMEKNLKTNMLTELKAYLSDQEAFALKANDFIDTLLQKDAEANEEEEEAQQQDEDNQTEDTPENPGQDENEPHQAEAQEPENTEQKQNEESEENSLFDYSAYDISETADGGEKPPPAAIEGRDDNQKLENVGNYHVYTRSYDELIDAGKLASGHDLAKLRSILDQQLSQQQLTITRLANRLQRKLMAMQKRSWMFDQEEGMLDASRLARIVANPSLPLSFKLEKEDNFKDTVVSLLIDNSGSMRGRPITIAAMTTDIIARTLERVGIKIEILGFTTRAWKGGKSRDLWVQNGRPAMPGRLNDVRHIVYKSADAPWRRSRNNLGLMLKEGLLKENIDGEALVWAHNRLSRRQESRKILMMISDGAPVDDSTLSVNSSGILESHLHAVINWIETNSSVELTAIGIGHDVTRYYNRAITITHADHLGKALVDQLGLLFEQKFKRS